MKNAKWTPRAVPGIDYRVRACLRAGKEGKGKNLGSTEYWPCCLASAEAHAEICAAIEDRAKAQGYEICGETSFPAPIRQEGGEDENN